MARSEVVQRNLRVGTEKIEFTPLSGGVEKYFKVELDFDGTKFTNDPSTAIKIDIEAGERRSGPWEVIATCSQWNVPEDPVFIAIPITDNRFYRAVIYQTDYRSGDQKMWSIGSECGGVEEMTDTLRDGR